jgi:uncharacterized membrane-anchored protein YjiN (DUF445 family)
MTRDVDLSPIHRELDNLKAQLCYCNLKGECFACKAIEVLRSQVQAVVAAASRPILLQVAEQAALEDLSEQLQKMTQRLMEDPEIQEAARKMQEKLMSDPEAKRIIDELMHFLSESEDNT